MNLPRDICLTGGGMRLTWHRIWRTRNLLDSWVSLSVIEGYEGDSQENNINSWSKQATPSPQRPPDINEFLSSSWHLDIHEVVNQDFFCLTRNVGRIWILQEIENQSSRYLFLRERGFSGNWKLTVKPKDHPHQLCDVSRVVFGTEPSFASLHKFTPTLRNILPIDNEIS